MINFDAVGSSGEPFEMVIEAGKAGEFALATGGGRRRFAAGDLAHPTILASAFHWQTDHSDVLPLTGLDPRRSLLGEQEFVFHEAPPRVGDRLVGTSRIDRVYEKAGRQGTLRFVEMVTEFRDEQGVLVAESRVTGVEAPAAEESPSR